MLGSSLDFDFFFTISTSELHFFVNEEAVVIFVTVFYTVITINNKSIVLSISKQTVKYL